MWSPTEIEMRYSLVERELTSARTRNLLDRDVASRVKALETKIGKMLFIIGTPGLSFAVIHKG
jgi:hypothetical protein